MRRVSVIACYSFSLSYCDIIQFAHKHSATRFVDSHSANLYCTYPINKGGSFVALLLQNLLAGTAAVQLSSVDLTGTRLFCCQHLPNLAQELRGDQLHNQLLVVSLKRQPNRNLDFAVDTQVLSSRGACICCEKFAFCCLCLLSLSLSLSLSFSLSS